MKLNRSHVTAMQGFTLVELVAVLVILGIVAGIGSQFIVTTVDSYRKTELRMKLISRGRASIEQMVRQLRNALPNSVRVSASGSCLEYIPIVGGANYLTTVADDENGIVTPSNVIPTAPFVIGLGEVRYAAIGVFNPAEIYSNSTSLAAASVSGGSPYSSIQLASNHRFDRNSINKRVYLTDFPKRFCLTGGALLQYYGYGLSVSGITDSSPSGSAALLLATNVASVGDVFTLSPGSENRNAVITIEVEFMEREESVVLDGTVLVRNVP
ncbi:PulJ/GspJ family protein [Teredinibacter purpureus]|uniref:PulJ/GspJ family protein n=1 Tax=Teredinibacter purpureus TaxID=2731756 RepID=UPI0005F79983|nr:type II secretion system protein [Teredinibacter purpureus]